eukprot:SAG31_NODE_21941_length_537_cov_1.155251_1_plen_23_part_01
MSPYCEDTEKEQPAKGQMTQPTS